MKKIFLLLILLSFAGYILSNFLGYRRKDSKFQDDIVIIRNYLIKNTSCLAVHDFCNKSYGHKVSLPLFNIFGGEILSVSGNFIGPFYVLAYCSFNQKDLWVSLEMSRKGVVYQNRDIFPTNMELCRLPKTKSFLCPSSKILQGFNEVGLPICTPITPFAFQNSTSYDCFGGTVLSRINKRDSFGNIEKKFSCKPSPMPDSPCPDCPCNEETELAIVPSTVKGLYRDVSVDPPIQSDLFCQKELSRSDALLCDGCLDPLLHGGRWVVTRGSTKLPQCNKRSINEYINAWNPEVTAFYLCKKMTSINNDYKQAKKENVFKKVRDEKGLSCFCGGVPWKGGDGCL